MRAHRVTCLLDDVLDLAAHEVVLARSLMSRASQITPPRYAKRGATHGLGTLSQNGYVLHVKYKTRPFWQRTRAANKLQYA